MESDIQFLIKDYLQKSGWFVYKNHVSGVKTCNGTVKNATSGIADLTAIKNGRILMLEVKSKTGRQREDQKIFEANWESKGGEYYVVRSVEDVEAIILTKYKCPHCGAILYRDSNKQWIESYCEKSDKTVRLIKQHD